MHNFSQAELRKLGVMIEMPIDSFNFTQITDGGLYFQPARLLDILRSLFYFATMAETVTPDVTPGTIQTTEEKPKSDLEPGFLVVCWNDPVKIEHTIPKGRVGRGLIAAVGSRLIEAAAKKMMDEFFRKFGEQLRSL